MLRLEDILVANGTLGLSGWSWLNVGGISDNGKWIVGIGTYPSDYGEAFVVRLPDSIGEGFKINAGLNDAWYFPDTSGQGFFITVFPNLGFVSLAWFTYDTELPPEEATSNLGDPGYRWITAVGQIDGNQAIMNIEMTSGGIFDSAVAVDRTDPPGSDGTIILTFDSCNSCAMESHAVQFAPLTTHAIKNPEPSVRGYLLVEAAGIEHFVKSIKTIGYMATVPKSCLNNPANGFSF